MRTVPTKRGDAGRRRVRAAIIVASVLGAAAGSLILLTSGPTEQATTKSVTATLHLPGSPDFAVVTTGGLTRFRRAAETPFNLVFEARP